LLISGFVVTNYIVEIIQLIISQGVGPIMEQVIWLLVVRSWAGPYIQLVLACLSREGLTKDGAGLC
jgi:hypothetical protein